MKRFTLEEKLALIPTDRPVTYARGLYDHQSPYWYATWKDDNGKLKPLYLGREESGMIAARADQQEARHAALDKRMSCAKHQTAYLWCKECMKRVWVKAHMREVWREAS